MKLYDFSIPEEDRTPLDPDRSPGGKFKIGDPVYYLAWGEIKLSKVVDRAVRRQDEGYFRPEMGSGVYLLENGVQRTEDDLFLAFDKTGHDEEVVASFRIGNLLSFKITR